VARARILLADDHKEIRDRAVRLLEPEFEVVGAVSDGNALVRVYAQLKPDVCIIDISMPYLNGIEAAIKLRENGSEARIVFLTVNEDSDFVRAKGSPARDRRRAPAAPTGWPRGEGYRASVRGAAAGGIVPQRDASVMVGPCACG